MTLVELRKLLPGSCPRRRTRDADRRAAGFPRLVGIARELFGPDRRR